MSLHDKNNNRVKKNILLVEDEEITLRTWSAILERNGFNVIAARTGNDAVNIAGGNEKIDLVLTDIFLGDGLDGIEAAEKIRQTKDIPVMFLSNHTGPEFVEKAERVDHSGYVIKSNGETVVIASIKMAFRLNDANVSINNQKQEIEAANEEMQAAMEELEAMNQELIETQRSLIDSEKKYRSLYESIRDAVVIVDMNGRIIDSNPAYREMMGYTADELKNFTYRDLSPDKWIEQEENVLKEQLLGRGYSDIYEKELIRKDGIVIPVEMRTFLIKDDSGKYIAALGIVRNISERKKAEREIFEREQKFRTIFEKAPYPISINRLSDGLYLDVNTKFLDSTGLSKDEVIGKSSAQIVLMKDPSDAVKIMEKFEAEGKVENYQFTTVLKSGALSHKLLTAYPVEINGEKCIISITMDITEIINKELALRKSEAEMKSLLDALLVGVGMIVDRKFVRVNSYLCSLLGYDEDELTGSFTRIIYIDDEEYERVGKELYGMISREGSGISKAVIRHRDGHILDGLITLTPIDPADPSAGYSATLNDITELNSAEKALRESEMKFKSVMEQSTLPMLIVDPDGTMVDANIAWSELWNADIKSAIGKYNIFTDTQNLSLKSLFEKALHGEPSDFPEHQYDPSLIGRQGEILWLTGRAYPLKDSTGKVTNVVIIMEDITERKRAVDALRESELRFKAIMEQSTMPMVLFNDKGLMIDTNDAWNRLWNADRKNVVGRYNILKDSQAGFISDYIKKAYHGEAADIPEHLYDPALSGNPGMKRWLTGRVYPLKDNKSNIKNIVMLLEDVTERKSAEEALRLSEEKFRNIFNSMTIGYFRTGMDGHIIDLNPACLNIFGFSSEEDARTILGDTTAGVYVLKSDWFMVRESILAGGSPFSGVVQLKKKDGTEFSGSLNMRIARSSDGTPLYIEGLVEDVTSQIKTQEMLIQSEKMITVAGLAAGMAHEINNPLGIIMQNAENAVHRLIDELPGNVNAALAAGTTLENIREYVKSRRVDQYLSSIREAGDRAAKIVGNMLQFSRGTESKISYININNLLDRALDLASNDYDLRKKYDFKNIRITKKYGDLPDIQCAETPIEQVFLNLFKNSAHAMQGTSHDPDKIPEINIKTENMGRYIRIEIGDNGPGMEEAVRKRIFEPFFSTKEPGLGTGLGLSVSYYIVVDGHGGTISVESSPGTGTLFIITLPVKREG